MLSLADQNLSTNQLNFYTLHCYANISEFFPINNSRNIFEQNKLFKWKQNVTITWMMWRYSADRLWCLISMHELVTNIMNILLYQWLSQWHTERTPAASRSQRETLLVLYRSSKYGTQKGRNEAIYHISLSVLSKWTVLFGQGTHKPFNLVHEYIFPFLDWHSTVS